MWAQPGWCASPWVGGSDTSEPTVTFTCCMFSVCLLNNLNSNIFMVLFQGNVCHYDTPGFLPRFLLPLLQVVNLCALWPVVDMQEEGFGVHRFLSGYWCGASVWCAATDTVICMLAFQSKTCSTGTKTWHDEISVCRGPNDNSAVSSALAKSQWEVEQSAFGTKDYKCPYVAQTIF